MVNIVNNTVLLSLRSVSGDVFYSSDWVIFSCFSASMVIFAWMPDTVNFKLSSGRYSVVLEISLALFQDALTPHVGNR